MILIKNILPIAYLFAVISAPFSLIYANKFTPNSRLINTDESTLMKQEKALFEAVEKSDTNTIEKLANEGVYLDVKNESGDTALHRAATLGDLKVIETLYAEGAYIYERDRDMKTPRDRAKSSGNLNAVELLATLEIEWDINSGIESENDKECLPFN